MINPFEVIETIKMVDEENLDIRTITMGISLLDCIDSDGEKAREKIYKKIKYIESFSKKQNDKMVLALFTCKEGQQWQFWYFGTLRKKQSTKTSTKKKPDLSRFLSLFLYFGTLVLYFL